MLIPRFSIRWLLGLTTVCAALSLVLSYAFRGAPWAIGVSVGLASLLVLFALHVLAFGVAWLIAQASAIGNSAGKVASVPFATESPFAASAPQAAQVSESSTP